MRLRGIHTGDVIRAERGGRVFYALVDTVYDGERVLDITPITRGVTYRRVYSREVAAHWRRSGRHGAPSPEPVPIPGQLTVEDCLAAGAS